MRRIIWCILVLVLLSGCSANRKQSGEEEPGYEYVLEEEYVPEDIDFQDWSRFYIAVYNEEDDAIAWFMDQGFAPGQYQEDLSKSLYFEIYHSIQGFESRYVDGPLNPEIQAEYDELEQSLIGLCKRFKDLGFEPDNSDDLVEAATFREFPALAQWLETEF